METRVPRSRGQATQGEKPETSISSWRAGLPQAPDIGPNPKASAY